MTKKIIKPKTKQKSIRFPLNTIKEIEDISLKERRSFGSSVIKIVEDFLKNERNISNI